MDLVYESVEDFVSEQSANISEGGLFVAMLLPPPEGTSVTVGMRLSKGLPLVRGRGEVVWTRSPDEESGYAAGMGVRFVELDERSRQVIREVVQGRIRNGGSVFDIGDAPEVEQGPASEPVTVEEPHRAVSATGTPAVESAEGERVSRGQGALPFGGEDKGVCPEGDEATLPVGGESENGHPFEDEMTLPTTPGLEAGEETRDAAGGEGEAVTSREGPRGPRGPMGGLAETPEEETSPLVGPPRGGRRWPAFHGPLVVAVGVVAVAVLVVAGLTLRGRPSRPEAATSAVPEPVDAPHATPAEDARPWADGESLQGEQPVAQEPAPAPTELRAAPIPAPAASRVEDIAWSGRGAQTVVTITADGMFASDRVRHSWMGDPPRYLIRFMDITEPFPWARAETNVPLVPAIRVGHHAEMSPPQLHVVLDLGDENVHISEVRIDGHSVAVVLSQTAGD